MKNTEPVKRPLTAKQKAFVNEYLVDLNATQAAIRCGYSAKTACVIAAQNLSKLNIAEAIQKKMDERGRSTEITAERVLKEIGRLAFFDVRKLFDDQGKPIAISALDDETAAAIVGIDVASIGNAEVGFGEIIKIKLADKSKALEQAGKHLKLFTDKIELEVGDSLAERLKVARERAGI